GLGVGTSNITAISGSITSNTAVLTVTAPTLVSIAVTTNSPSIAKGLTQSFTATGTYTDNSTQDLTNSATWNSSNGTVASINASGVATALSVGSSNITATSGGITSNTAVLTVTAPTLLSIAVTPNSPSIAKGLTQSFTATGTYTDNSTQDLTNSATWNSSNTDPTTVNYSS